MLVVAGFGIIVVSLCTGIFICAWWIHTCNLLVEQTREYQEKTRNDFLFTVLTDPLRKDL